MGEAVFSGVPGGFLQAAGVAVGAAVVDIRRHCPDKIPEAVVVMDDQLQIDGSGVVDEGVPAGLVLLIGMDVGIEPEADGLYALGPERINAVDAAWRTAGVEKKTFHSKNLSMKRVNSS